MCNFIHLYIEPALVNNKNIIIYCCIESYNVFSYNADQVEITLGHIIDVVSLQEINANLDSVLPHQSIKAVFTYTAVTQKRFSTTAVHK